MKKKMMSVLILIAILLTSCASKPTLFRDTSFDVGFNTPFTLMLYTKDKEEFDKHFEDMKTQVRLYNSLFDIYNNYEGVNNIKTINDQAGIAPVKVDRIIIDLLLDSKAWTSKTDNRFNPTLGPVLKIWHTARENGMELNREGKYGPSPDMDVLLAAKEYSTWDYVEIDEEASTVYLTHEIAALDVGAIAKGWVVEKLAQHYEENGITSGIVNGGGNVRTINGKIDGPWNVGVTNPDELESDESLMSLLFDTSMSVVTSGDYERYFVDDQGRHQHHLIDSETLQPTQLSRSVTITTKNSGVADVLSTAFSMTTLDQALELQKLLNIEDLGLLFVYDTPQDHDGFNYLEVSGKHLYFNDTIKDSMKE